MTTTVPRTTRTKKTPNGATLPWSTAPGATPEPHDSVVGFVLLGETTENRDHLCVLVRRQQGEQATVVAGDYRLTAHQARNAARYLDNAAAQVDIATGWRRPLFPPPLHDDPDHGRPLGTPDGPMGVPDPDDPTDTVGLHGYCSAFCDWDDVRTDGIPVAEHGPLCTSGMTALINSVDKRDQLSVDIAEPYRHGTYPRAAIYGRGHDPMVRLGLTGDGISPDEDDPESRYTYVSIGDARRLAAGLLRACDVADQLDYDLAGAKARREADQ